MSSEKQRLAMILAILVSISIALAISATPSQALSISAAEPQRFLIVVSRHGFNGTADALSITVQQGDLVNITFLYGDNDLGVDNPHAIMIYGYGIRTVNIDRSNSKATVQFVADSSGTFSFYCYIPCLGMENLLGHLIVTPAQGQATPSTLDLAVTNANSPSGFFLISATVKDTSGQPLAAVPVKFYENTSFGRLWLGTVPTNSQGVAVLNYTSSRTGKVQIIAENPGSTQYAHSSKSIFVTMPSRTTGTETEGQIYLGVRQPSPPSSIFYGISYPPNLAMIGVPRLTNIITITLVGVIVLSVWSTYAYLARQIAGLPKQGGLVHDEQGPATPELTIVPERLGAIDAEIATGGGKMIALLVLVPLLGVADMMLVDALGFSILSRGLCLVGLAAVETAAVVAFVTGGISDK
jgi:hypothetical protein